MPYGYTSRRHDEESRLMYFRARYYDTSTGEFCSRDPLEYVDGMSMNRGYVVLEKVDPDGMFSTRARAFKRFQKSQNPTTNPVGPNVGKVCAVTLKNYPGGTGHWLWVYGAKKVADESHILQEAGSVQEILDWMDGLTEKCCTLYVIGHQGGGANPPNTGGATTFGDEDTSVDPDQQWIFPNKEFEENLKERFKGCGTHCAINLVTCGGVGPENEKVRQDAANRTGCIVCSSNQTISGPEADKPVWSDKDKCNIYPCTLGTPDALRSPWPHDCTPPEGTLAWKYVYTGPKIDGPTDAWEGSWPKPGDWDWQPIR